ncbi:hypothetical protein LINPERHAP2_LOCUS4599 [Linum perenne]
MILTVLSMKTPDLLEIIALSWSLGDHILNRGPRRSIRLGFGFSCQTSRWNAMMALTLPRLEILLVKSSISTVQL